MAHILLTDQRYVRSGLSVFPGMKQRPVLNVSAVLTNTSQEGATVRLTHQSAGSGKWGMSTTPLQNHPSVEELLMSAKTAASKRMAFEAAFGSNLMFSSPCVFGS